MSVIASKYVVLDVETNGLSSLKDDLLSISIYQPDTQKMYNRFLPLELNGDVYTTHINGITKKDLKKATPITQNEVDELIDEFDLCNRIILTYGSLDEKFIKNYFKRKGLCGYERLNFFNFKRNIISSPFSGGNVTKDNLCRLYGIDNVQEIHTGVNDCILEWELFKKLDSNKLLITNNKVFEFNEDYIVPVSYLTTYPNFKYHTRNLPRFKCNSKVVKKFEVASCKIKKFPTNFNGITIEHLINKMLHVEQIDSSAFLVQNKSKLKYIGKLPSWYDEIYMDFNEDGTVNVVQDRDKKFAEELNKFILMLKEEIAPLVEYIKKSVFKNKHILSQELVVHKDKKVLAQCDLSSDTAVLEIKTYKVMDLDKMGSQLFYESNGRDCYIMQIEWSKKKMTFTISKVKFEIEGSLPCNSLESRIENFKNKISNKQVDVVEFIDSKSKVILQCQICGNIFSNMYKAFLKNSTCPYCNIFELYRASKPKKQTSRQFHKTPSIGDKDNLSYKELRSQRYFKKLKEKSDGNIKVLSYNGAKERLFASCNNCGHGWNTRADHLLERPYCPNCKKLK